MVAPFSPRPFLICAALSWGGLISVSARAKRGFHLAFRFLVPSLHSFAPEGPQCITVILPGCHFGALRCSAGRVGRCRVPVQGGTRSPMGQAQGHPQKMARGHLPWPWPQGPHCPGVTAGCRREAGMIKGTANQPLTHYSGKGGKEDMGMGLNFLTRKGKMLFASGEKGEWE